MYCDTLFCKIQVIVSYSQHSLSFIIFLTFSDFSYFPLIGFHYSWRFNSFEKGIYVSKARGEPSV